jgi:hypothetical protein
MTAREALAFVKANGIVLESGRGPVPNLAELIAGERIKGSWWGHEKSSRILHYSRAIRDSKDVLVCRLVAGKVTYVHRRLWPALIRLRYKIGPKRLNAIREIHTAQGKHHVVTTPFLDWVPADVVEKAEAFTVREALAMLPLKLRAKWQH